MYSIFLEDTRGGHITVGRSTVKLQWSLFSIICDISSKYSIQSAFDINSSRRMYSN